MKKTSQLFVALVLAASFVTPILATAATASDCTPYQTWNFLTQKCDSPSSPSSSYLPSGSSGLNVNALVPYKNSILNIINGILVPVLFAIAFLYFIWGVYKYFILGATEEAAKGEGRQFVLWSLVGFAVILSIWGLVNVITSTFGFATGGSAASHGLNAPTL